MSLNYIDDAKTAKEPYTRLAKEIVYNETKCLIGRKHKNPTTKKFYFNSTEISRDHAQLFSDSIMDMSNSGTYLYLINGDSFNLAQPRPLEIETNSGRIITVGDHKIVVTFTS